MITEAHNKAILDAVKALIPDSLREIVAKEMGAIVAGAAMAMVMEIEAAEAAKQTGGLPGVNSDPFYDDGKPIDISDDDLPF